MDGNLIYINLKKWFIRPIQFLATSLARNFESKLQVFRWMVNLKGPVLWRTNITPYIPINQQAPRYESSPVCLWQYECLFLLLGLALHAPYLDGPYAEVRLQSVVSISASV